MSDDMGLQHGTGADDAGTGVTATLTAHRHSTGADHDELTGASPDDNRRPDSDEGAPTGSPDEAVPGRSVDEIERLLGDVEAALGRLDDGTYGRCAECGAAIDDERLAASPVTTRCASCAAGELPDPPHPQDPQGRQGP
jgi:RNA polymerase-binding transcription factor DksA